MTNEKRISEHELNRIFVEKKNKKFSTYFSVFKYFLLFIVIFIVVYSFSNFGAIKKQFSYWYKNDFQETEKENTNNNNSVATSTQNSVPIKVENNRIIIEKISVNAPIVWNVVNEPAETAKALESGVIQLKNTAQPGEIGNVFITGHSSNFTWSRGDYKDVFALLDKLVVGDQIVIGYNNINYKYKVEKIFVVKPSETSVLNQTNDSTLTLMTCTPVGTSLKRLIVQARQISPDPSANKKRFDLNPSDKELPNIR